MADPSGAAPARRDWTDSPLLAAVITWAIYALFLFAYLSRHSTGLAGLVRLGSRFVAQADSVPPGVPILPNHGGYDGQFYYRLAVTPFTHTPVAVGIRLDSPAYRQQRILYPLLARAVAGGRIERIPLAMALVNFLLLGLLAALGARIARAAGHHALWGLAFSLSIPLLYTMSRDLTEILETTLLAAALLLRSRHRFVSGWLLALAVLARETALFVAVAIALAALIEERGRLGRAAARVWPEVLPPVMVYVAWQSWLWSAWGVTGSAQGGSATLGLPLAGLAGELLRHAGPDHYIEIGFILLFTVAVGLVLREGRAPLLPMLAWVLYTLLLSLTTRIVWVGSAGFFRAFSEACFFGTMLLLSSRLRPARWMLWSSLSAWAIMAAGLVLIVT